jgi:predicted acylesterase/phospholipase RssA
VAEKRPVDSVVASRVEELEQLSLDSLRELAGVKKPGFVKRMFTTAGNWLSGINLALAIGPTVGHLIIAKELTALSSAVTGEPKQSPMDWLRENRPNGFSSSVESVMKAGSSLLQSAMGLSLSELSGVEQHFYNAMAPVVTEDGIKTTAPFLRELAKDPTLQPGQSRSAFVFLGHKRADEAESVTKLWNSKNKPPKNPFHETDQRSRIWESLEHQTEKGSLPIFVDMDGDYSTFTGTEFVAKKTLSSLGERNNSLGDDFADTSRYFAWLTERQESYSRDLSPYLAAKDPKGAALVTDIKADLTPPWLDGEDGMGPWTAPDRMREIPGKLSALKDSGGQNSYVDALISLDRDVLTGVQTHWIKLLRELKRGDREELLGSLPGMLFDLNLRAPHNAGFEEVSPADAPGLSEIARHRQLVTKQRPYDRAVSMKEVLDHTLDGLGIAERRTMLSAIRAEAKSNLGQLEARESRLRTTLGQEYSGLDVKAVVGGKVSTETLRKATRELLDFADQNSRAPAGHEARRHASMLEFLNALDSRYGEVDQILPRIQGDFSKHPLGVSEYFIPPAPGAKVSPLRETEPVSVTMGNSQDPSPTKMSLVFEGGGGRGFAYLECLKQLEGSFVKSEHGYEVDEYVGTSAGSIVAVLLAAGYRPGELREVMEGIDFTAFNADAAWLMGGVDPKARGVDRTGLFSTQKMYLTFHKLLADKLGVEGRPVLFSDMPHKLKLIATMMNTDMSSDNALRENIDGDGRFVFSGETTPNFDVVGALVSSSAVPAFFQLPQILAARPKADGETERTRMQFGDGGVIDNLSLSSASRAEDERSLLVLPAHTQTRHPVTGEWVGLDTLNFGTENLDLVDAHNKELYGQFVPKLDGFFQRMKAHGSERAVIGFNLCKPWQQPLPAVQGSSEVLSLHSLIHAKDLQLPVLSKVDGDAVVKFTQRAPNLLTDVAGSLFDRYFDNRPEVNDGAGDFHRDEDGFHFHPPSQEATDLFSMGWAAGGAALSASKSEYAHRRFQQD